MARDLSRDRLEGVRSDPLGFSWITPVGFEVSTRNLAYLTVHQFDVFTQNIRKFSSKLFEYWYKYWINIEMLATFLWFLWAVLLSFLHFRALIANLRSVFATFHSFHELLQAYSTMKHYIVHNTHESKIQCGFKLSFSFLSKLGYRKHIRGSSMRPKVHFAFLVFFSSNGL